MGEGSHLLRQPEGIKLAILGIILVIRFQLMAALPRKDTPRQRPGKASSSIVPSVATKATTQGHLDQYQHAEQIQPYSTNVSYGNSDMNVRTILEIPESQWQNTQSPMKELLKVYVYEGIDPNFTTTVEEIYTERVVENPTFDYNIRGELVLFKLFRSYPGRTYNPEEADIFVVPYPHYYHCLHTMGYSFQCGRQKYKPLLDQLWSSLPFYDAIGINGKVIGGPRRHLFITGVDNGLVHKRLSLVPLHVSIGPIFKKLSRLQHQDHFDPQRRPLIQDDQDLLEIKGDIVVPYVNDHPMYQPSMLHSYSQDSNWTRSNRRYSMVYFYGINNRKMMDNGGGRRFREYFEKEITLTYGVFGDRKLTNRTFKKRTLGGKPFLIRPISNDNDNVITNFFKIYKNSIFCLCLPGDGPAQKRFFDVILSGCIPVVLEWPIYNGTDVSWFMPDKIHTGTHRKGNRYLKYILTAPSWASYPYWNTTIDYKSFVVRIPSNPYNMTDMSHIMPYLENLLLNPSEILQRQIALQYYAPLLTWGMGNDAHLYEDSFTELLKSLKDYLLVLTRLEQKEKEQLHQKQRTQYGDSMLLYSFVALIIMIAGFGRSGRWGHSSGIHLS